MTTSSRPSAKSADTSVLLDDEFIPDDQSTALGQAAEIVVKGRTLGEGGVPEHFRNHVSEKLSRLERFDPTIYLFDVELTHERNRRQRKNCQRIEITARGKGPVVRAEACADSFYGALELAIERLEGRLRRLKDRRRVHHGDKTPISVSQATAGLIDDSLFMSPNGSSGAHDHAGEELDGDSAGPGHVVRTKTHPAIPMTIDDALYQMELVGHDFFLFQDKETDRPSVVYRRHAFDYGIIRLA
ncbi:MAG: Light-repressed protein [Nocardia sp.]|nr:Light-repressed protein [Nocardia sp.]